MHSLFEDLQEWPGIIVTGPQRAGTTICAKMIAHDTGYRFVDEHEFGVSNATQLRRIVETHTQFVAQAPALVRYMADIADDTTLVVCVRRDVVDIIASQRRIRWSHEASELARFGLGAGDGPIAQVKYDWWDAHKDEIAHTLDVEYESLAAHPLWVPKAQRANFGPKQTEVERGPSTMTEKVVVQCASCRRAVWTTDVDDAGNCVLCAVPPEEPEAVDAGGADTDAEDTSQ